MTSNHIRYRLQTADKRRSTLAQPQSDRSAVPLDVKPGKADARHPALRDG